MKIDKYGQVIYTEDDLCNLLMSDPERSIKKVLVEKSIKISDIIDCSKIPTLIVNVDRNDTVEEFDKAAQSNWLLPEKYSEFDIAKYVLDLCQTNEELQRAGHELLLFHERGLLPLLTYLKYLVDVMRENNIVWGVGRGSSVASFVLFLIGIHRINSLYYDLSIEEFLK